MINTPKTKRRRKMVLHLQPATEHRTLLAARLDRAADFHLHLGFHSQAERLARRAADLRGAP
jgi:hypothetical protein